MPTDSYLVAPRLRLVCSHFHLNTTSPTTQESKQATMKSFILALLCLLALARSAENNINGVDLNEIDETEIAEANAAVLDAEEEV